MEQTINIPKNLTQKDLIIVEKSKFEKLTKENEELRAAIAVIVAGEFSLQKGKTRSFREFLKSDFSQYAKNR